MWLFAIGTLAPLCALNLIKQTRQSRTLWGQLAAASFPVALFFACALLSAVRPAAVPGGRVQLLAVCSGFFCAFAMVKYLLLARRGASPPGPAAVHPLFLAVLGLYLVLCLVDVNVSPIWDAGLYFSSLLKAVSGFEFTFASFIKAFSAQGHLTQALMPLYAPGQYLFYGSVAALNLTTTTLGLLVLCAYYRVMQKLFPDKRLEPVAATALLAFMPQVFAFATGLNPDFGVFAGFVFLLYCHCYDKRVLAVAAALLVIFSKETGILVYGGFGLGVLLFQVLPRAVREKRFSAFWRHALRLWYYLLPLGAFFAVFFGGSAGALSSQGHMQGLVSGTATIRTFRLEPLHMLTVLNQSFVLNFNWVATLLVMAGFILWCARLLRTGEKGRRNPAKRLILAAAANPAWGILAVAVGIYLLFTLVYVDYPLLRYNLATLAILPPLVVAAAGQLPAGRVLQKAVPGGLLCLYLLSCYLTVDPASRFAFPYSHSMGNVRLLDVTNHTGFKYVCERHVYNRQYLHYSRLLDMIAADWGVDEDAPYASYDIPEFAMQFFGNYARDYRLQYAPALQRRVFYASGMRPIPGRELFSADAEAGRNLPKKLLWIVLPYQDEATLEELAAHYTITGSRSYTSGGLQMQVYECTRNP